MIRYYRTNIPNSMNLQRVYQIDDKTDKVLNVTNGIAEYVELAIGTDKHGLKLVEIDGDTYDKAIQQYLKGNK